MSREITETEQDPLAEGDKNIFGGICKSKVEYIPYSTAKKYQNSSALSTKKRTIIPEVKERKEVNTYLGTKRAFLAAHAHKAQAAKQLLEKTWENQERLRSWNYKQQMKALETNIKIRNDNTQQRISRARNLNQQKTAPMTTGPTKRVQLPRDIQVTEYPRNHILYWG